MHSVNLMPVSHIIQIAAMEADNLANTLQADAPETAVYVLNELDEVAGCISLADLRQTFPRFSLGHESAGNLEQAAASLAARAAGASL
jgi:PHD/YefM family antitoxin component YafN of YafNO toxin-antitoxin module